MSFNGAQLARTVSPGFVSGAQQDVFLGACAGKTAAYPLPGMKTEFALRFSFKTINYALKLAISRPECYTM